MLFRRVRLTAADGTHPDAGLEMRVAILNTRRRIVVFVVAVRTQELVHYEQSRCRSFSLTR